MTYPAILLISRSWNLSGIVAKGFETVSGDQSTEGLFLLNELLDIKSADINLIPYYKRYGSVFVTGQEEYFINGLVSIETMTFNLSGPVRYPMNYCNRDKYFGSGRVNNIMSIPFEYYYNREEGGSRVYVYYLPDAAYPFDITGKFSLTNVSLQTDLSLVYDGFYIAYLRYALAKYMCQDQDITFPSDKEMQLQELIKKLNQVSPPDFTTQKVNFITNRTSLNWAQINIGKGWTV